jgi:2-polyprenyl-3-methyl-5-hydroxy-6-metoxy-1,4-benzoquinol methylase
MVGRSSWIVLVSERDRGHLSAADRDAHARHGSRSPIVREGMDLAYYTHPRTRLVERLPKPLGRTLDVGCGGGGVGQSLRDAGAMSLVGIELSTSAAALAGDVMDEVFVGRVEDVLCDVTGPFDTICCYDILEHLADPGPVVSALRGLAAPGGHLHVSVPNARKVNLVWDLMVRGTFGYRDSGHRDRTHLRWFTHRDIVELIGENGWAVLSSGGTGYGPKASVANAATFGVAWEFWSVQVEVLAEAK